MFVSVSAHDTRNSASHPLRHSIINLVRAVGELRASSISPESTCTPLQPPPIVDVPTPSLTTHSPPPSQSETRTVNGAHYLLTSLTLFTTHEPCIMCSMALLHSRVKEVFYLFPMAETGGCGSLACLPRLNGVNHRYGINAWRLGEKRVDELEEQSGLGLDEARDA